jgi:hypothetical protein
MRQRVRDCTGKPGAVFGEDLQRKAGPRLHFDGGTPYFWH